MSDQHDQVPATRTISRAIAILRTFDAAKPELGVTELSHLTGLDKATVYRLLSALQQGGLVEQNPETAKYHLGLGLLPLAGMALAHLDLPRVARPHLQKLAHLSQETVNLSVVTEDDMLINIDCIASPRRVRNVGWIGREMPLHAVSGGKVMMAYMSPAWLERVLARELQCHTEHTLTNPAELRAELEQIRQVGFAIAEEELEIGLSAVAAPVWDHEDQVAASVSVSGPSFRLPRARLTELGSQTKEIADAISRHIGYVGRQGVKAKEVERK
jgi:DNA-binding IclR family transcriptional regulator